MIPLQKWNKRWVVLHATSHEGVVRLTYFDDEESELRGADVRTVNLRNCTGCCESSVYKTHPYAFQFTTAMGQLNAHRYVALHIYMHAS